MHQNCRHFIHRKVEQCVGQRKKEHHFLLKNVAVAAKEKYAEKTRGENMGFETTSAIISDIVFNDNETLTHQKLNMKLKNEVYL